MVATKPSRTPAAEEMLKDPQAELQRFK
jgi:hypothetical protein